MILTFLGTGTSVGVPMIGCECDVCRSSDPRDTRRRTSVYLRAGDTRLVVDTAPDFREQALTFGIERIDALLFTHSHADHIFGLDDVRRYNTMQGSVIPAYACADTIAALRRIFDYVEAPAKPTDTFRPRIEFRTIEAPLQLGDVGVTPLPVEHGPTPTLGYRFDGGSCSLGYIPDCHVLPSSTLELVKGVDVMVLDGLRHRPHPTHLTVGDCLEALAAIGAGRSYLVHMCHDLGHAETQSALPDGVEVSYDGLTVEV